MRDSQITCACSNFRSRRSCSAACKRLKLSCNGFAAGGMAQRIVLCRRAFAGQLQHRFRFLYTQRFGSGWPSFAIAIPPLRAGRGRLPSSLCKRGLRNLPAQLVLDMHAHDLVEFFLGLEAELARPPRVDAFRPTRDNAHDQFVWLPLDARSYLEAGDAGKRLDLLGYCATNAGHCEVDTRAELLAGQPGGVNEETDGGAR